MKRRFTALMVSLLAFALLFSVTAIPVSAETTYTSIGGSTTFTSVPATLVPEQITAYVNANFPNATIKKLEKKYMGWEIELNNGLELKFNKNFKVMEIDD